MHKVLRIFFVASAVLALPGCTDMLFWESTPPLELTPKFIAPNDLQKCVVEHIQKELGDYVNQTNSPLLRYNFVGIINLQMDVTDNESLGLSLNYTDVLTPTASLPAGIMNTKTETAIVGGQLGGQQHVMISTYAPIVMATLKRPGPKVVGTNSPSGCGIRTSIKGDLGLSGIIDRSFSFVLAANKSFSNGEFSLPAGGGGSSASSSIPLVAQVDFQVVEGLNGGPTLSATHFKLSGAGGGSGSSSMSAGGGAMSSGASAAGGGSQSPLNFMRTTKDTLLFSLVPTCKPRSFVIYPVKSVPNTKDAFFEYYLSNGQIQFVESDSPYFVQFDDDPRNPAIDTKVRVRNSDTSEKPTDYTIVDAKTRQYPPKNDRIFLKLHPTKEGPADLYLIQGATKDPYIRDMDEDIVNAQKIEDTPPVPAWQSLALCEDLTEDKSRAQVKAEQAEAAKGLGEASTRVENVAPPELKSVGAKNARAINEGVKQATDALKLYLYNPLISR
jgi:hypothetical protein